MTIGQRINDALFRNRTATHLKDCRDTSREIHALLAEADKLEKALESASDRLYAKNNFIKWSLADGGDYLKTGRSQDPDLYDYLVKRDQEKL